MPSPRKNENRKDFIKRCVPIVMDEGTAKNSKQAVAICYSLYKNSKTGKSKASEDVREIIEHLLGNFKDD